MNKKTIIDKILNESIDDKINELTSRLEEKINILEVDAYDLEYEQTYEFDSVNGKPKRVIFKGRGRKGRSDSETQTRREEKVEREPPPPTPEVPSIATSSASVGGNVVTLAPVVDTSGAMQGLNISAGSDRDVVPLVRINPDYPPRALSRGLEGWVQVQFTITETGSVADATVVDASPKGVFDDAAIKAILRWRYNPKVEGAVAVARKGVQTSLRFQLEDN